MTLFLASANLLKIFGDTDIFGQILTIGLGFFSLIAWTVMFGKYNELKRLRELNLAFEQRLREERSLLELPESLRNKRSIPYADLFADAVEAYWRAAAILKEKGEDNSRARLEHSENAIQRAIARQALRYEASMIFLATIVSGAPFLGLLGTVWGVMSTFSHVAQQNSASLTAMAPGVAAALITTVAGLLVAIPSMFGYNWLVHNLRVLTVELDNFAQELVSKMETEYLEEG